MPETASSPRKSISPDWLVRGLLTKLGDTFDRLTGRGWKPSSSLATSELIERLKALLDSEAEKDAKGTFVPHNIKLRMQWDKFSADSDGVLQKLENELLTAAVDHINDRRYYTHQPLSLEVKPDYFTTGVKLFVSFDRNDDDDDEASVNILADHEAPAASSVEEEPVRREQFVFTMLENGKPKSVALTFEGQQRKSVGRTKENDLTIADSSVSKLHASLMVDAARGLIVADTGSTNGTYLNGRRIAYGKAEPVGSNDTLSFGTVEVRITQQSQPGQPDRVSTETLGLVDPSNAQVHTDDLVNELKP
jgi:hypothetical protein